MAQFKWKRDTNEWGFVVDKIVAEGCRLAWQDFPGARYGKPAYGLVIDDESFAQQMIEKGWPVKLWVPSDPDESPSYTMKVGINFRDRKGNPAKEPPVIMVETDGTQVFYSEETLAAIDRIRLETIDTEIAPVTGWDRDNANRIAATCKKFYARSVIDELDRKWMNTPIEDETIPF